MEQMITQFELDPVEQKAKRIGKLKTLAGYRSGNRVSELRLSKERGSV